MSWSVIYEHHKYSLFYNSDTFRIIIDSETNWLGLDPESGSYDTHPSDGNFFIPWDDEKVVVIIAKYGDGRGGSMTLEFPADGFHKCLQKLK